MMKTPANFTIWKYSTLAIGITLLLIGGEYYQAPDWDIGIILVMAFFAFVTAPWSTTVLLTWQWKKYPAAILLTWWGVDGCYWVYWSIVDPVALELMRDVNWPASLVLFLTCGILWSETLMAPAFNWLNTLMPQRQKPEDNVGNNTRSNQVP